MTEESLDDKLIEAGKKVLKKHLPDMVGNVITSTREELIANEMAFLKELKAAMKEVVDTNKIDT